MDCLYFVVENATAQAWSTIGEIHQRDQDQTQDQAVWQQEELCCQNPLSELSPTAGGEFIRQLLFPDTIYPTPIDLHKLGNKRRTQIYREATS